jgi:DNA polymerase elongation subunit (family B)
MSQEYREELHVYNECSEHALIERFFLEVILAAPRVFVTYNGDYFDWPFVEKKTTRAAKLGISIDLSDWNGNQCRAHRYASESRLNIHSHGCFPLGQSRFISSSRLPRSEGGHAYLTSSIWTITSFHIVHRDELVGLTRLSETGLLQAC